MPYAFTPEDFSKFSDDVIKAEGDQATLTSLLADMQGTITDAIAKDVAATEKLETTEKENERLRKANMDLFLRVGKSVNPEETKPKPEEKPKDTAAYMREYFERNKEL